MGRHVVLAAAVALGLLALGAGGGSLVACKTSFDCQGRDLPLIGGLFPDGEFVGIEQRGSGDVVAPEGFRHVVVASGFELPTAFALLPDGRFLVAEKSGLVRVVSTEGEVLERPFLDLREQVNERGEGGLVHLAASPAFAEDGLVYLLYSHDDADDEPDASGTPRTVRLTRVTAVGDVADPASEVVLLGSISTGACADHPVGADCIPMDEDSHAGGTIRFDREGNLLVSTGDGSHTDERMTRDALRAQDLDSLAGKILRVAPDGRGLPDNPFWNGDPTPWALQGVGVRPARNLFRFSTRRAARCSSATSGSTRGGGRRGRTARREPRLALLRGARTRSVAGRPSLSAGSRGLRPDAVVAPWAWHASGSVTGGTVTRGRPSTPYSRRTSGATGRTLDPRRPAAELDAPS
ncbi:MAG: PQQ-dependent sugar dehydrogenase [Thermoleophilia bacterium]